MWGSDQAASLEPSGITRLVRDIRLVETSMGSGEKKVIDRERPIIARLRERTEMFESIKAVAMDVDGVLTDGAFWWGSTGEEFKRFCFAMIGNPLGAPSGPPIGLGFW